MKLSPPDPPLRDDQVALREISECDASAVEVMFRDPDWVRWFGAGHSAATHIETAGRCWTDGSEAWFTICAVGSDDYAGEIALRPETTTRANVEYWLLPKARGHGWASRAVDLVTAWAFSDLALHRVQLWTEPQNVASQRVAIASGYVREGVLRCYDQIDGRPIDSVIFSRSSSDRGG